MIDFFRFFFNYNMPKGTVYLLHLFNSTFGNVHLKEERKLLDQGDLNVLKSLLR